MMRLDFLRNETTDLVEEIRQKIIEMRIQQQQNAGLSKRKHSGNNYDAGAVKSADGRCWEACGDTS